MLKIQNNKEIEAFIKRYEMEELFTDNMKEQMNLFLFNKNEYICREEEQLEYMYFLVKGKAKVSKHLENGKSLLISFYTPLTIIGDVEFIGFTTVVTAELPSNLYGTPKTLVYIPQYPCNLFPGPPLAVGVITAPFILYLVT